MAVAAAEITPTETPDRVGWGFTRSRRTQAVPRNSLFGTNLDHVDQEELKDIKGRYIPEGFIKESPNRYPLPPHIKEKIPGRNSVQTYQKQFAEQRDAFSQAEHQLKDKSEKSLSFRPSGEQHGTNHNSAHSQHPTWLSEKDLKHSKDINIVGLSQQGSYNRDKYQKKPQVHNYSLIGDILAPKMDFNSPRKEGQEEKPGSDSNTRNIAWGPGRHLPNKITEQNTNSKKKNLPKSVIDIPPNIRHQFGSRICDSLLSDHDIVSLALERQKSKMGPTRPSKKENIESLPLNLAHNYESLGNTTRYNICPGVSSGHTISRTKDEFNDEVHQRRVPATDEFRCQRDELSTWSEHNVLRERMKKAWNEAYPLGLWVEQDVLRKRMENKWKSYYENQPKVVANWDRNAKRAPVVPAARPPPAKAKPKAPQKQKQKPNETPNKTPFDDEPEIVFVTPPLTPPPQEREMVELPKAFEKDNEFWGFYDQQAG